MLDVGEPLSVIVLESLVKLLDGEAGGVLALVVPIDEFDVGELLAAILVFVAVLVLATVLVGVEYLTRLRLGLLLDRLEVLQVQIAFCLELAAAAGDALSQLNVILLISFYEIQSDPVVHLMVGAFVDI